MAHPDPDLSAILGRIAGSDASGGSKRRWSTRGRSVVEWSSLMSQLGRAMSVSAQKAGLAALASGRWLADVVVDAAPRIPVRDLATLQQQHPGLHGEALADALVTGAVRGTMAVGVAGGALTGIEWAAPVSLVVIPVQLAVEVAAVAAIEIKLVAELHEVYGVAVHGTPTQRGTAYALSWANRRGVNPLEPATVAAALGVAARRRVQRRLLARFGRGIGTLAPLMAGAAYGAYSNRRQTQQLADSLRSDLRRRPLMTGLTGNAVVKLLEQGGRSARLRRRRKPAAP